MDSRLDFIKNKKKTYNYENNVEIKNVLLSFQKETLRKNDILIVKVGNLEQGIVATQEDLDNIAKLVKQTFKKNKSLVVPEGVVKFEILRLLKDNNEK